MYYLNTNSKLCLPKNGTNVMDSLNLSPYPSKSPRVAEARGPMEPVAFLLTEPNLSPSWAHIVHWTDATKPLSLH